MTFSQIINVIGLTSDITGVLLLFKFGLPPEVNPHGHVYHIGEQDDPDEAKKWTRFKKWSNVALIFLIIGFILQVVSTVSK
ncbi:MAG: hypothetical protein ACHQUC_09995 [Chlamydiales bacterium]